MEVRELYRQANDNKAPAAVYDVSCSADENATESQGHPGRYDADLLPDAYLVAWLGNIVSALSDADCSADVVAWFAARGVTA